MNPSTQIYYWPRSFVLRSTDFVQNKPYQRISTTLIVAVEGEFAVQTEDLGELRCGALLLGPSARRLALQISAPGAYLIEAAPNSLEHYALMQHLRHKPSRVLDAAAVQALRGVLADYRGLSDLSASLARELHSAAIRAICPVPDEIPRDARVEQVLAYLDEEPLDEVSIASLAQRFNLSESRLRSVVRRQLHCSLSQYVRWLAAWRTMMHWQPGITLTDAAHAAGFHDLSHANHTFNEMFGLSPSRVLRPEHVQLVPCAVD